MTQQGFDPQLFDEFFGLQPQATLWLMPVRDHNSNAITGFNLCYANEAGRSAFGVDVGKIQSGALQAHCLFSNEQSATLLPGLIKAFESAGERMVFKKVDNGQGIVLSARRFREGILLQEDIKLPEVSMQAILDASVSAVVTMEAKRDPAGTIIDFTYRQANQAFCNWLGKTKEELIGRDMIQLFPATMETGVFALYSEVIHTGLTKQTEVRYAADGKELWIDLSIVRLNNDTAVGFFNDITARHAAMEQVAQQNKLLDNILSNTSNGISVTKVIRNEEGEVIDAVTIMANEAAIRNTGLTREKYLSSRASELDPQFISSAYFKQGLQTLQTGEPVRTQYRIDATGRWIEVSLSRLDSEHLITIFADITSIKETQLTIERSAARLQAIINRTQAGICTLTPLRNDEEEITDFYFGIVNEVLSDGVRQEPPVLAGQRCSRWFPGFRRNGLLLRLAQCFESGEQSRFEFHYNEDGIHIWIDIMCTRIEEELLVTFSDITSVKTLQLELEKSIHQLQRSNNNLEEFAYAASHDLQEPLRKINFFSEKLRTDFTQVLTPEIERLLGRMEDAAARMKVLIDDLLAYSRVSVNPDGFMPVSLAQIVSQVVQDFEGTINKTGATIRVGELPQINGDARQLSQLFQNLVGNALKYRKPEEPPLISIQSSNIDAEDPVLLHFPQAPQQRYHLVQISDNGIGFEQEYAEKIFQVFQRLHGRHEYEGTGVGLAIVQKVMNNHKGFIAAVSEVNKGATFFLLFPLAEQATQDASAL